MSEPMTPHRFMSCHHEGGCAWGTRCHYRWELMQQGHPWCGLPSSDPIHKTVSEPMTPEERLAAAQHDIWSHWMRWFFNNDSPENRERWKRQMVTPYADLSEREKESDRKVVREFLGFAIEQEAELERLRRVTEGAMAERDEIRECGATDDYRGDLRPCRRQSGHSGPCSVNEAERDEVTPTAEDEQEILQYAETLAGDVWDRPSIETRQELAAAIAEGFRWFYARARAEGERLRKERDDLSNRRTSE